MASDLYNKLLGIYDRQTADVDDMALIALKQEAEEDIYVAEQMQAQLERLVGAQLNAMRPAWGSTTETQWEKQRRDPKNRKMALDILLRDTPPEAWAVQQQHFRQQAGAVQLHRAKAARIKELRPAIDHDIRAERPDLSDPDHESEVRRRLNSVLGQEGFSLVPTDPEQQIIRTWLEEPVFGFTRGVQRMAKSLASFGSDTLGHVQSALGFHHAAEQSFASGTGARRRGAEMQKRYAASEDLGVFEPGNPRWYLANVSENLPQYALMLYTGHIAGAVGKSLGLADAAIKTLQVASASSAIGVLEAAGAYEGAIEKMTAQGVPLAEAREHALGQAAAVGLVNAILESIPAGEYFRKLPGIRGRLVRALRVAATEAGTEFLQEITAILGEGYAMLRATGHDIPTSVLAMGRQVPKEGERLAAAPTIGAILGGLGGAATPAAAPNIGPRRAAPTDFAPGMPGVAEAAMKPGLAPFTTVPAEEGPTILPFQGEDPAILPFSQEQRAAMEDRPQIGPILPLEQPAVVPPEARIEPEPPSPIPFPREAAEAAPTAAPEAPAAAPDITETERDVLRRELAEEKQLARRDVVSKGPNIVAHKEAAGVIFEEADQTGESVGVVRTDLGNFKGVNDQLGHDVGDQLLQAKAEAFAEGLRMPPQRGRPSDYAGNMSARIGGDEFGAFIRKADSVATVATAMDRVTALFDAKAAEIIGNRLPPKAYPFIAWGAEIRKAGDTRTLTELEVAADTAQEAQKAAHKAELGIPPTREELAQHVAEQQAETVDAITEDLTDPDLAGRDPVADTEDSPAKKIASARLGDRSGHIDAAMLNALLVGVPGMAGEAGRIGARLHRGLIDQGAVLRAASTQGSQALDFYQAAHNLRSQMSGRWFSWFYADALHTLPRRKRGKLLRWMDTLREDGQTNWSTFLEHPDRMAGETLPAGAEIVREGFLKGYREAGLRSETERLPQMKYKVGPKGGVSTVLGAFKRAATPRYARHLTTAGRSAFQNRTGETWDAVVEWLSEHPDRNPGIPGSSKEIEAYVADREQELEAATLKLGATRKARSFAHVRLFQELPVAVTTASGKVVEIQLRKPIAHIQTSFLEQASQLALWQLAREELLPMYGRYQKDTGMLIYPLGAEALELMDAEGLIERLRNTVVRGARVDPAAARKAFDTTHDNYTGPNFTGRTDEMLSTFDDTTLGRVATTPLIWAKAGVLSLSGLYDLIDWTKALPGTGLRGLRGFFKAQAQVAAHPTTYAAEYRAMGVLPTLHNAWTVYRNTAGSDILRGGVTRTLMRGAQATEHWKQFSIAKMHDEWLSWFPEHPGRISKAQADYMRNILRLTPTDIAAINAGEMTPRIRAKALQNAVNSIAGLTEAAINKGMLQNSMIWRFLVPFTSVVSGTTRLLAGMGRGLASNVRIIMAKNQPQGAKVAAAKALVGGLSRVLMLVAAIAGTGFLQTLLRRIAKARPLVDPEDPKTWEKMFAEALAEGGVWGPYGRLIDAYLYSDGDLRLMLPNLSFPLATIAEFATAVIGWGPYQDTDWTKRLQRLGTRYFQVYSVAQNWLDRVAYPDRQRMAVARKYVRVWRTEQGEDVEYPRGRRNRYYYAIYEAIRDGDDEALRKAKIAYKAWAREKGRTLSDARQDLGKSLNSYRPINLNPKRRKAFLKWLPEDKRNDIEDIDRHYRRAIKKATRKPGPPEPPKAQKPAKPAKPGEPGFWGNWSSQG